jgi:hypothetical protein
MRTATKREASSREAADRSALVRLAPESQEMRRTLLAPDESNDQ